MPYFLSVFDFPVSLTENPIDIVFRYFGSKRASYVKSFLLMRGFVRYPNRITASFTLVTTTRLLYAHSMCSCHPSSLT